MERTFCGKSCEDCTQREAMACPGCLAGPGKKFGGECDIAKCCRDTGHESCVTCTKKSACGKFSGAANAPANRQRRQEQLRLRKQQIAARAEFLSSSVWYLFWVVIVGTVFSLVELIPAMKSISDWASLAVNLTYSIILIYMAQVYEDFKTAGWIGIVAAIASAVQIFFPDSTSLMLIVFIPLAGFRIYGNYVEFTAFGAITDGADAQLSERWLELRKWYIISFGVTLGGTFLLLLIPALGLIAALLGALASLAVSVYRIIYLYRTAVLFREYR